MDEHRSFVPAWGVSLILHGVVIGLAFAFATQVKPVLQEDLFQWDVALVGATKPEVPRQTQAVVTPQQPPAKVMPPPHPKRVTEVTQAIKPREQKIEPPPSTIEQRIETPQERKEPIEQRLVEVAEAKPEPIVEPTQSEPGEAQPVQQEVVAQQVMPAESSPQEADEATDLVRVAKAPALDSEAKMDHRWLAESLWRRVAELKRYPNSARMNGQEGKVILKAVIRSDGQLADVFVQKSSGYEALDTAAMEAVKLACPLTMKRAMGKPQIVVSLPIVYSLTN